MGITVKATCVANPIYDSYFKKNHFKLLLFFNRVFCKILFGTKTFHSVFWAHSEPTRVFNKIVMEKIFHLSLIKLVMFTVVIVTETCLLACLYLVFFFHFTYFHSTHLVLQLSVKMYWQMCRRLRHHHFPRHPPLVTTAKYLVSCEEARMLNPTLASKDITIDLDDSGPLEPFPVTCVFQRK